MPFRLLLVAALAAMSLLAGRAFAQPGTIRYGDIDTTRVSTTSWNGTTFEGTISWGPFANLPTGPLALTVVGDVGTVTAGMTPFVLEQPYAPPTGNWSYFSESARLDSMGARAVVRVSLPDGVVYRFNTPSDKMYHDFPVSLGFQFLDQELRIAGAPIIAPDPIAAIKIENEPFSFPLVFGFFSDADGWTFTPSQFRYTHNDEFADGGGPLPSNDGFLQSGSVLNDTIRVLPGGASFTIVSAASQTYLTAFPSGVVVGTLDYSLTYTNNRISSGTAGSGGFLTNYRKGSCSGVPENGLESYGPAIFAVGSDGALIGAVDNSGLDPKTYTFDAISVGPVAANGTMYLPGWRSTGSLSNPAAYLLAGRDSNSTAGSAVHYPGEEEYELGAGSYAGYNLSVSQLLGQPFSVVLACANAPFDSLASKMYIRRGGLSGTLDANPDSVAALPPLNLYGDYSTVLTKFNYTFLDNLQHQTSEIDGSFILPFPADVTLPFDGLELAECGAPGSADIVQPTVETLSYWAREFRFSSLTFRSLNPPQTQSCAGGIKTDKRSLWTLSTNPIPEVARSLMVETRFSGGGNILDGFASSEAETRIQNYDATVRKVYYSKYPGNGGFGDGFTVVAADVVLPFWGSTPIIALWDGGLTPNFFDGRAYATTPPGAPDPDNNGFPAGINNLAQYLAAGNQRPLVIGSFANIIPLEYRVRYDPISRRFATVAGEESERDLVVINVNSNVRGITKNDTEILFGLAYEGLPVLNLSSIVGDIADPVVQELLAPLKDAMTGLNSGLSGALSDALKPGLEAATRPAVNSLVTDLKNVAGNGNGPVNLPALQAQVSARIAQIENAIQTSLNGGTGPLVSRVDQMLSAIENIAGKIESLNPTQLLEVIEALAGIVGADTSGIMMVKDDVEAARAYIVDNLIGSKLRPALMEIRSAITQGQELVNLQKIQQLLAGPEFTNAINKIQSDLNSYLQQRHQVASKIRNLDVDEVNRRVVEALLNSVLQQQINKVVVQLFEPLKIQVQNVVNGLFDTLNNQLKAYLDQIGGFLNDITAELNDVVGVKAAEISGYAVFGKTSLDRLHLDAAFELAAPDDFGFRGALDMERFVNNSNGVVCGTPAGQESIRVKISVFDIPIRIPRGKLTAKEISLLLRLNQMEGEEAFFLSDVAGMIDTQGEINFEAAKVLSPFFAAGVGLNETFIAFRGSIVFNSTSMRGGIFLGRTCNAIELLSTIDPEIDGVITSDVLTGIYAFGEAAIPIIDYSCMLRVGATAGAGFWLFMEGPTIGGKLTAGVYGEGICIISVRGKLVLIGNKDASGFTFKGIGWIAGGLGWCEPETWFVPSDVWADKWCWTCILQASVLYKKKWSVDYDADCEP